MRKANLAFLAAVTALSLFAAVASARTGLTSDDTAASFTFPTFEISGGLGVIISCSVTLDVTLHASVAKTTGALAGFTRITTGRCTHNTFGLLSGRSRVTQLNGFHLTYNGFEGTLPSINRVSFQVNDVTFWIRAGSIECLTEGPQDIAFTTIGGNPADGGDIIVSGIRFDGDFPCDLTTGYIDSVGSLDESIGINLI